ncbi:hypothetical protein BDW72DRAFT_149157 [Aspergillus terricola var. indicus]
MTIWDVAGPQGSALLHQSHEIRRVPQQQILQYNDLGKRYLVSLTYVLSCQRCIKSEHMPFSMEGIGGVVIVLSVVYWSAVFSRCLTKSFMFNGIQMSILFGSVACSMITFILVIISFTCGVHGFRAFR